MAAEETGELLFGLRRRVARREYVRWGFGLALLKFLLDTAVVYACTGKTWSPLGYVVPSLVLRSQAVGAGPEAMHVLLAALALPFLWIGLTMSVRRAADASVSPWLGTLFVVPLVNYVAIALLCVLPSRGAFDWAPPDLGPHRTLSRAFAEPLSGEVRIPPVLRAALGGVLASMAIGAGMLWLCIYAIGIYGVALFFVTPFAMGVTSAVIYNRRWTRSALSTIGVTLVGLVLTGCSLLLFAVEGVLCILMAAPIAAVIAIAGALIGRAVVSSGRQPMGALVLVLPVAALGEGHLAAPTPREVTTEIEIDAPPERVWPHVVGFADLDEPPDWFFRLGIAYPRRARIEGEGVGAVRRCEFSTGPFIEPITVWQPPTRLAFDVTSQPPSMTEWSPYGAIHAPHIEGYMTSRGGEFDLQRLPGGRTRLSGTTHYTLAIYPEIYWVPYAEALVHAIHRRVLAHVKRLSEESATGSERAP
jgi:uncharacterized membrane protein YhaH (DUF805 family)